METTTYLFANTERRPGVVSDRLLHGPDPGGRRTASRLLDHFCN